MKTVFYNKKERVVVDYIRFEEKEFIETLLKEKPKKIFHNFYSKEKPCWIITNYLDENKIEYYADSWSNKTPIVAELTNFYKYVNNQGLTKIYFETEN